MSSIRGDLNIDAYQVGQIVNAVGARYETKRTAPPDRYDMATILDAMLSAHQFAKSEGDRKILRQVEGIGTARTRQAIVEGLVRRGLLYTERKGKRHVLRPSDITRELRRRLPPLLTDVAMTAKWEIAFAMVERGEVDWRQVVDRTYVFVGAMVDHAKGQVGNFSAAAPAGTRTKSGAGASGRASASKWPTRK